MNAKEKIEELLEASEDGTITAAQVLFLITGFFVFAIQRF